MTLSIKKMKVQLLGRLTKESIKKICRIEKISTSGTKDEIVERLAKKLSLTKVRRYSKKLSVSEKFSIFRHVLVPEHRIISEKEKKELLEKYGITLRQLPKIRVRDPAALTIDAKVGDVIEIKRKSPTAGETKYYRI